MHGQQNDKYTEMHGQQNDKYTEMHGQQNVKKNCLGRSENDTNQCCDGCEFILSEINGPNNPRCTNRTRHTTAEQYVEVMQRDCF